MTSRLASLWTGTDPWVVADLGPLALGAVVDLGSDTTHHLRRVLRRRDGDGVVVTDGCGQVAAGTLTPDGMRVDDLVHVDPPTVRLRVVQGLAKRSRHDEVVRMLTEVGVDHITAATTQRCQVDIEHKRDRVRTRWDGIVTSACAQSRRAHRPIVDGPMSLDQALPGALQHVLVAHPGARLAPLAAIAAMADHSPSTAATWTAVIGPEGGLTDDEVARLEARGAVAVSLGPSVLRTEHAGLALAAVMAAGLGRM